MARRNREINPEGADRNGLALFVFLLSFVVGYVLSALVMAAVLEGGGETLPRDSIWKILIFWAMVIATQLVGLVIALTATRVFVRRYNRSLLFYVAVGLGLIGVCLYSLFLLVPPTSRSILLVLFQLATAWVGYLILRIALKRPALKRPVLKRLV